MTTWTTAASATGDADVDAQSGFTHRVLIASAALSGTGQQYVRVTFEASSAQALTVGNAYIGTAADAGDAYDFAAAPTTLTFSGAAGFAINAGASIVSDKIAYSITAGKNLIVSFYVSGDATHDSLRYDASIANWTDYYKEASDAATVDATGYSTVATRAYGVMKVEAGRNSAFVMICD